MCGYAGVSVENDDDENTASYGFYEIGIRTDPNGKGQNSKITGVAKYESGPNITVSTLLLRPRECHLLILCAGIDYPNYRRAAIRAMASRVARVVHPPRQNGTRSNRGRCIYTDVLFITSRL